MITIRNLVKPSHPNYKNIKRACRITSSVYNCANYIMRQAFFNGEIRKWNSVDKEIKYQNNIYKLIPAAASQATIKKLGTDWISFFKALKSYDKNPEKFKKRPKPPTYSNKLKSCIQPFQALKCVDNMIHFPKKLNLEPMKGFDLDDQETLKKGKIKEVRFVPHGEFFWFEIVCEDKKQIDIDKKNIILNKEKIISIDLGINNLLTIVSNDESVKPIIIKGNVIKSINQRYNKKKAYFQAKGKRKMIDKLSIKRFCQINDYMHKASNKVIEYCLKNDIGTIIIGKNNQWKNEINIGKVNNQKFVNIPFESLIQKIEYKAKRYNIEVRKQEESYTSKSDSLALDTLPKYKKNAKKKHVFLGRRVKRGLYKSSVNKLINADINGAINILRKVIGDDFVKNLINKGFVFNPEVIALQ